MSFISIATIQSGDRTTIGKERMVAHIFDTYPNQGRIQGRRRAAPGQTNSRKEYGHGFRCECGGNTCGYCGRDMGSRYEDWLASEVDHVVPMNGNKDWTDKRVDWTDDWANLITCCRDCNGFTNGVRVEESEPATEDEFLRLRDRYYQIKKDMALEKHRDERSFFEENVLNRGE